MEEVNAKQNEVVKIWSGYYMKGDEKIELTFKDFKCPIEGGAITGLTVDGETVKGTIQNNY